ncbi:hypothetical protein AB4865_10520 [Capnocytophaga sp. ARDL2]|uniref:hypothetical protein n=1 Tax=Capnocytophaga sp. ARDL2 TaxID=3238809 RepID=UPI0035575098
MRKNFQNTHLNITSSDFEHFPQLFTAAGFSPYIRGYEVLPKSVIKCYSFEKEKNYFIDSNQSSKVQKIVFDLESKVPTIEIINSNEKIVYCCNHQTIEELNNFIDFFIKNYSKNTIFGINFTKNLIKNIALVRALRAHFSQINPAFKPEIAFIVSEENIQLSDYFSTIKTASECEITSIFFNEIPTIQPATQSLFSSSFSHPIDPWAGNDEVEQFTLEFIVMLQNNL